MEANPEHPHSDGRLDRRIRLVLVSVDFPGLGTVINVITVIVGALAGMAIGQRFPERTKGVVTDVLVIVIAITLMSLMVVGDFSGDTDMEYLGGRARFYQEDDERYMHLDRDGRELELTAGRRALQRHRVRTPA